MSSKNFIIELSKTYNIRVLCFLNTTLWTVHQEYINKLQSFEMWCYGRMLKISCSEKKHGNTLRNKMTISRTYNKRLAEGGAPITYALEHREERTLVQRECHG